MIVVAGLLLPVVPFTSSFVISSGPKLYVHFSLVVSYILSVSFPVALTLFLSLERTLRSKFLQAGNEWKPAIGEWKDVDYEAQIRDLYQECEARIEARFQEMMDCIETTGVKEADQAMEDERRKEEEKREKEESSEQVP